MEQTSATEFGSSSFGYAVFPFRSWWSPDTEFIGNITHRGYWSKGFNHCLSQKTTKTTKTTTSQKTSLSSNQVCGPSSEGPRSFFRFSKKSP